MRELIQKSHDRMSRVRARWHYGLAAAIVVAGCLGAASAAQAREGHWQHGWGHGYGYHHGYYGPHYWVAPARPYYYGPPVYGPPVVYAPAYPAYPPGFSLNFNVPLR